MESNFAEELEELPTELEMSKKELLEAIKGRYNGYTWGGRETLYNPFSLLSFMKQQEFKNFWFATGTPTFLIKQIQGKKEYQFEGIRVSENSLGNFDIVHTLSAPLLFQTGYLTIKKYDKDTKTYTLDYPNKEVEESLLDALLSAYRNVFPGDSMSLSGDMRIALQQKNIPKAIEELNALISTIPYDHWKADTESIFHIIIYLTFKKIGLDVYTEVHNARGRCDVLVKTADYIYAIELKLNATASAALNQVFEKGYLDPFQADPRKKIAIGINFSSEKRQVESYEVKEL